MNKTIKILARILLLLYLATVAYLCFGKFNNIPEIEKFILGIPTDKVVHFLMFFPFPILLYFATGHVFRRNWTAISFAVLSLFAGAVIAAGTELGQALTAYRSCDIKDFYADTLSLAISALSVFILNLIHSHHA